MGTVLNVSGALLNVNDYSTKCQWVHYYMLTQLHAFLLTPVLCWAQERHSEESTGFSKTGQWSKSANMVYSQATFYYVLACSSRWRIKGYLTRMLKRLIANVSSTEWIFNQIDETRQLTDN